MTRTSASYIPLYTQSPPECSSNPHSPIQLTAFRQLMVAVPPPPHGHKESVALPSAAKYRDLRDRNDRILPCQSMPLKTLARAGQQPCDFLRSPNLSESTYVFFTFFDFIICACSRGTAPVTSSKAPKSFDAALITRRRKPKPKPQRSVRNGENCHQTLSLFSL